MPVIDKVSADYADQVSFLAVAWRGTEGDTRDEAAQLIPSGRIQWGLDDSEEIFGLYGIPYQPASVLITHDGIVFDEWAGAVGEDELRSQLDALVATAP